MIITGSSSNALWDVDANSVDDRGRYTGVGAYLVYQRRTKTYEVQILEARTTDAIVGRAKAVSSRGYLDAKRTTEPTNR